MSHDLTCTKHMTAISTGPTNWDHQSWSLASWSHTVLSTHLSVGGAHSELGLLSSHLHVNFYLSNAEYVDFPVLRQVKSMRYRWLWSGAESATCTHARTRSTHVTPVTPMLWLWLIHAYWAQSCLLDVEFLITEMDQELKNCFAVLLISILSRCIFGEWLALWYCTQPLPQTVIQSLIEVWLVRMTTEKTSNPRGVRRSSYQQLHILQLLCIQSMWQVQSE